MVKRMVMEYITTKMITNMIVSGNNGNFKREFIVTHSIKDMKVVGKMIK